MAWRLGIVGLGKIAQDQHLPVVAKNSDFKLAAVVSSRGGHGDLPAFKTFDELLASRIRLDAVSLCMPPGPRFLIARKALEAGLHVLMEKPPTPTIGELEALVRHAKRAKRVLFSTWHSQYNRAVDEAKKLLKGKTITSLFVNWKEDVRHWHPGQAWIWEPGGFGVFDPGINAFSAVTKILPEEIFVDQSVVEVPRNKSTAIAARIRFKPSWQGEADLRAELDWRQTGEQTWDITAATSDGLNVVLRKGGTELYVNGEMRVAEPSEEYEGIYVHFAKLLAAGRSHVDAAPLRLVSDALMLARLEHTEAFED